MTQQRIIASRVEPAYGQSPDPLLPDAIQCSEMEIRPIEGSRVANDYYKGTGGANLAYIAEPRQSIRFRVNAYGSARQPHIRPAGMDGLLRACLFEREAYEADGFCRYFPRDPQGESVTISARLWDTEQSNGILHRFPGALGSLMFRADQGQLPYFMLDFMALYRAPQGEQIKVVNPDFAEVPPPLPVGEAAGSRLRIIDQQGNDLSTAAGILAATGKALPPLIPRKFSINLNHQNTFVSDYHNGRVEQVRGEASGEMEFVWHTPAQFDHYKSSIEGQTFALIWDHGKEDGSMLTCFIPRVQSISPTYREENGRLYVAVTLNAITPNALGDVQFFYWRDAAARSSQAAADLLTPFNDSAPVSPGNILHASFSDEPHPDASDPAFISTLEDSGDAFRYPQTIDPLWRDSDFNSGSDYLAFAYRVLAGNRIVAASGPTDDWNQYDIVSGGALYHCFVSKAALDAADYGLTIR